MVTMPYVSPKERKIFDVKTYSNHFQQPNENHHDFYKISTEAKDYVLNVYDKKIEQKSKGEIQEDYAVILHDAVRGKTYAVNLIKKILEDFIIEKNYRDVQFPPYYKSLIDALFEEEFGWGPLSAFKYETDCEAAQVLGTDIKFKRTWGWELQDFKFKNLEQVFELAKRFSIADSRHVLNPVTKPELETSTGEDADNIRVSIMIPERMHDEPVITLRRKKVKTHTFEKVAELNTIPYEAVPLLKLFTRFWLTGVVAGPPGTAKSTILQTMLNHMLYETWNGKKIPERYNTIYAESNPEFNVRKIHPKANILHLIGSGEEFEKVIMSSILRHDITRIVLGEIREHEVGLFKGASLRGIRAVLGTLHDLDPEDVPRILTDLYLQYYPNNNTNPEIIYETFIKTVHYSISMDEVLINGTLEKKVVGIQFYDIDENKEVKIYKIMDYDYNNDTWTFSSKIPERIARIMSKYHSKEFEEFTHLLKKLEVKVCV